jgi:hypothetical protein
MYRYCFIENKENICLRRNLETLGAPADVDYPLEV